jgi:hypothetical protein
LQDGRFRWTDPASGHVLDVRIATSPALAVARPVLSALGQKYVAPIAASPAALPPPKAGTN